MLDEDRPELRSACCNAPVQVVGKMMKGLPKLIDHWEYICHECTNFCSIRNPNPELEER